MEVGKIKKLEDIVLRGKFFRDSINFFIEKYGDNLYGYKSNIVSREEINRIEGIMGLKLMGIIGHKSSRSSYTHIIIFKKYK